MNIVGNSSSLPIAIVGGGVTGLSAAYHLAKQGHRVRLFESTSRLGGNVLTERADDWLVEAGPNSLQLTPEVAALLGDLGLTALTANPTAKKRYLVRDGRLVPAPGSPPAFLKSPLFSASTKFKVLGELFRGPQTRTADVSLAEFAAEHFGSELVDRALRPFVSGVYAGDASQLSARLSFPSLWEAERTHGSLIRAQIASAKARRARGEPAGPPPIVSFAEGLETLPRALAARLPAGSVELNARVLHVLPGHPAQISWTRDDEAPRTESFAAIILALPAPALAALPIGREKYRPLSLLSDVEYPPVSALFLGFRREQVVHPLDGFGVLVPPSEKRTMLGALFNSTLFPRRAPEGHVALTVMTGGALRPEFAQLSDTELWAHVSRDLGELLGVRGDPVFLRRRVWPRAIPQYKLGYDRFLEAIFATEAAHPGLLIGGHVRDGISLPNCLAAGEKLAVRALAPTASA